VCSSGVFELKIHYSTDQGSIFSSAPIRVPFKVKLLGKFSLKFEVWNETSSEQSTENQNNLITQLVTNCRLATRESVYQGGKHKMRSAYHVICDKHQHDNSSSQYCRPRDDTFGHYTCNSSGSRICLEGWNGEYCTEPICLSGCSKEHGYCDTPGECSCREGWRGPLCDECKIHPVCLHGTCSQPWQCNCKEGWGGLFCDQDLKRRD
ncbi:hypothetical protein NFI96_024886, partial [Prochilodus magdalenae]